jgi:hypothetical protein
MAKNPDLYVGCALTHAPKEYVYQVDALKERLNDDWQVLEFLGLVGGTVEDVYRQDILTNVHDCKVFLGLSDFPSIGLGWELREATMLNKPTLAVAHRQSKVTRLLLGAPAFNPALKFMRYENMVEDVPRMALEEFAVVRNSLILPSEG